MLKAVIANYHVTPAASASLLVWAEAGDNQPYCDGRVRKALVAGPPPALGLPCLTP